ncbi:hypothetical protein GCK72_025209 [Caenorhabditis remanei]|uniref:Uncharacterized protein n=1 Tax=Caenorhabditis remanei TaxID=31234 RepID=A0A6A5G243_CAERE|nr:hypothetical protein GCK72_025209 [Caenorhabditis remanei]KAF1748742.1 hypothetical protein GCK72_025209 [Caenorhabditis remanei]
MVDAMRNDRIRLTELLGGHEEFQQLLDYVVDIAVEINRIGQLPASNVGREMVNNYLHYLREVVDNIIDLLG